MAGAGYIRRFSYFPGTTELQAIEGVVIVDQRSPGPIRGASTGVVGVIGECSDMSHCCSVNSSGAVVSKIDPVEVYGSADLIDKIGPFDRYLGEFGDEMGNMFVELRNKQFSRLVVVPVDIVRPASTTQYAIRIWRQLPTNRSATDTTPIVPVIGTKIPAGTRFDASSNRCYTAAAVTFTGKPAMSSGVDGTTVTTGLPAATTTIERAAGSWITDGAAEGDLIVPGSLNAASASQNLLCAGAGTLRIVSVDSATTVTVEKLSGANFAAGTDWAAGSALAWRLHHASDGDSSQSVTAGHQLSEAAGYTVLARPGNATISSGSALTPNPQPTAPSGTYWDVTAGLMGVTHPSGALTYDASVHAANLAATSLLRTRYQEALDSLLNDDTPENEVSIVVSARKDATIQAALRLHVLNASARGMSRVAPISPKLDTLTKSTVLGSAAPGVGGTGGAVRHERVTYHWPGVRTFIPELVGISIATSDGLTTDDGICDTAADGWVAALMSVLPPENNIGQALDPVPTIFAPIIGYQRGTPALDMNDYILFKQYGVSAFRMDRTMGPLIQSGVTTSLTTGESNINRRRMADYIQDSLAARYNQLAKMVARQSIKDTMLSETDAFLSDLLAEGNPDGQRIAGYSIDDKSLNTQSLAAQGIHVIKIVVQLLQTLDTIVLASEVSPNADITVRQV